MEEHETNDQDNKNKGQNVIDPFQPQGPRDGLDNTGTQGKDSLKDDGYTGSADVPDTEAIQDGTGSSSEDFTIEPSKPSSEDEDKALDKGI
jgi:hypothetical protein